MEYRRISQADASFLTELFSPPEYDLYFAESKTTKEDWVRRMPYYTDRESYIIWQGERPIGWVMYSIEDSVCVLDLLIFLDQERHKGYGSAVIRDIIKKNQGRVTAVTLDVQEQNTSARRFYEKIGFRKTGEEMQPVTDHEEMYYNLKRCLDS